MSSGAPCEMDSVKWIGVNLAVQAKFKTLGKVLLVRIILASSIITTVMTAISFYLDFQTEVSLQDDSFKQIESAAIPGLTNGLWNLNVELVQSQLDGIGSLPFIVHTVIYDFKGRVFLKSSSADFQDPEYLFTRKWNLVREGTFAGTLEITATRLYIYER